MAFERALVYETKGGFLLSDLAAFENLVDIRIEIARPHFDVSGKLAPSLISRRRLFLHEIVKRSNPLPSQLAKKKVP